MYKPSTPYATPMFLFVPEYEKSYGVNRKKFPACGKLFYGTFRTFGGTERDTNGVYVVEDTAKIETWYRPDIKSDCQIECDGERYEILGTPENVQMRNQYLLLKVRHIKAAELNGKNEH